MIIRMRRPPRFLGALVICSCFFSLLLLYDVASAIPQGPHISTLNVLLPPKTANSVRFRLQGSGGCFVWTWDHHDIIHVAAEVNGTDGCSDSAIITSIATYNGRRATSVYAKDFVTGKVLRCEVFIDKIFKIQIAHHSLKLDLDGLATLRVHAFDMEDNVFSSLVGIPFSWKLSSSELYGGTEAHCLAQVPLKDTPLSDCGCICADIDTRIELEDKGLGSDLYVVKGISVGHEKVSVNVLEPTLEALQDEISLTVAEAISIEPPSPLFVLVDTQVQYTLKTYRNKLPEVIQLPSPHHQWSIVDAFIADVDPLMGRLHTKRLGRTNVIVEDIRLTGEQQISTVHVVTPSTLQLYLTPLNSKDSNQLNFMRRDTVHSNIGNPWYLVIGWDYVVQVLVFSAESSSTSLYMTKGNNLELAFNDWPYWKSIPIPEDVQSEQGWRNGSLLKAVSEGAGRLSASLKYKSSWSDIMPKQSLTVEQEVIVCSPVHILLENDQHASILSLPWNPKTTQTYPLRVGGGCGVQWSDYEWVSSNPEIIDVNSFGIVHVKAVGQSFVQAMTLTNPLNIDEVKLQISYPSSILKIEGLPIETEVGSHLLAAVTLRNPDGFHYSKCESFSSLIDWRIKGGDGAFVQADYIGNEDFGNSQDFIISGQPSICGWMYFFAAKPGRATVTASLEVDDTFESSIPSQLTVSWTIAAYAPLTVLQYGNGHSYGGYDCDAGLPKTTPEEITYCEISVLQLVPGSSMKLMLKGGPERWGHGVNFVERHEIVTVQEEEEEEQIYVTQLTTGGGRLYEVMCTKIGNYTVTFYRGNSVGEGNTAFSVESVNLTVVCSMPSSITLLVDDIVHSLSNIKTSAQASRDKNSVHKLPVTVVSARSLRVASVALNSFGLPFANASSLPIQWVLTDCSGFAIWEGHEPSESHLVDGNWEETLQLLENAGQCLLRAAVNIPNAKAITDAVQLQIVTSLRVSPKFLLLYNNVDAKDVLTVRGGSSHIEAYSNDTEVAIVLEQPIAPDYLHMTIAARGLGVALVTIQDVGLSAPASDNALVSVAEVAWIRLLLPEDASIEVGSSLKIKLQAGDNLGNIFGDSQFEYMDIEVHIKDDILDLDFTENPGKVGNKISGSVFSVRGSSIGLTDIYVSVSTNFGHEIVSELRSIEVYEPFSLMPEGLVIAPGTHYTLLVRGGPSIGTYITFSSLNDTIASVENSVGLIVANFPGVVLLLAQSITHGGVVVCEATLEVNVEVPKEIVLNVRGGRLAVDNKISIFPTGIKEDMFSFYELCRNYRWTVGDPQILSLQAFEDLKESTDDGTVSTVAQNRFTGDNALDARFSVVAIGRSTGKTDVSLGFSCHFNSKVGYSSMQFYTATASIQVIPHPPLALGLSATLLLPPNHKTSNLLPQSTDSGLDSSGKRSIIYSLLQDTNKDSPGISIDAGYVKTSERKDLACIQARDRRTGRSEVAVCIRVAEVAHLMVGDPDNSVRRFEMSVGTSQMYSILLQDDIGAPFNEVGKAIQLIAETNRIDIVSVKIFSEEDNGNSSVLIQALRQGTAMVRISQIGNPNVVDYIMIHVGAFIFPRNPTIHVGGSVNFSLNVNGRTDTEHGHWSSSNTDVIRINENSGEAYGVGPGSASVSYNSSHLKAYTMATVVQISAISIKALDDQLTNVNVPDKGYLFLLKFSDPRGQDVGIVSTDDRVSYKCHIDPPYIGRSSPRHDPVDDKYFCVFYPYSPERLFLTLQGLGEEAGSSLTVGDSRGYLTVKIIAEVSGIPEVGSVLTSFAGGFSIRDGVDKVKLSSTNNRTKITVVGSAGAVNVTWTRNDALQVRRVSSQKDAYGFGGHAVFEVVVINGDQPFVSTLRFRLPTTGQVQEVQVQYDIMDGQGKALVRRIITAVIAVFVLGVLPFLACSCLFDLPRRRQRNEAADIDPVREQLINGSPRSPVANPMTPSGYTSPHSLSLSRSPPEPYTEYVSRTIGNTPYFRRETMRHSDPSRTY